jgi:hypothetical protein
VYIYYSYVSVGSYHKGYTPLHVCIDLKQRDLARLLLSKGKCNANAKTKGTGRVECEMMRVTCEMMRVMTRRQVVHSVLAMNCTRCVLCCAHFVLCTLLRIQSGLLCTLLRVGREMAGPTVT